MFPPLTKHPLADAIVSTLELWRLESRAAARRTRLHHRRLDAMKEQLEKEKKQRPLSMKPNPAFQESLTHEPVRL